MNQIDDARVNAVARLVSSAEEAAKLLESLAGIIRGGGLLREIETTAAELRAHADDCRLLNV